MNVHEAARALRAAEQHYQTAFRDYFTNEIATLPPVVVKFKNVRENRKDHLNCTWLFTIKVQVLNALEHVMRAACHELGKCPQGTTEFVAQLHDASLRSTEIQAPDEVDYQRERGQPQREVDNHEEHGAIQHAAWNAAETGLTPFFAYCAKWHLPATICY